MRPAIASWIVTGDAPVSYWPMFFPLSLITAPDVFAKVDWVQFPSRFYRGKLITRTVVAGTCGESMKRAHWAEDVFATRVRHTGTFFPEWKHSMVPSVWQEFQQLGVELLYAKELASVGCEHGLFFGFSNNCEK